MSIIDVTGAAIDAVREAMKAEELTAEEAYLRVGVKGGGCSGLSYVLALEKERREDDRVIEAGGVRLLVDPKSELFLAGTQLDYSGGLNGKGFVFRNPNAQGTCGCGSSFNA